MTMVSPRTKPGTTKPSDRKLSEVARKVVVPHGITSTGWPAVRDTCGRKLGVAFDPWQDGVGRIILAKRADGKLAAMISGVGLSLPRQVGKTYLIGAMVFALCINMPGLLVIWSAHHAKTHGETFLSMQAFAERSKVAPYIEQVFVGSGDEEIRFRNGSRILFGARERGFGRGIPGVDVIVSDEAQIMSDKALDAQLATMNTSQFGLAIFMGTPPRPDDPSEAFTRMRSDAYGGLLTDGAWIEFGAAPGVDPHDRREWANANPSYPLRTPVESILRLKTKLKPDSFLREALGVWDVAGTAAAFGPGKWEASFAPPRKLAGRVKVAALAVAASHDLGHAAIVASGRAGAKVIVKPLRSGPGMDWVPAAAKALQTATRAIVVIDGKGPAASLIPELKRLRVRTHICPLQEAEDAYDVLYRLVAETKTLEHGNYPELNRAVEAARPRRIGDRKVWERRYATADISPLDAATLAAWWADRPVPKPPPPSTPEAIQSQPSEIDAMHF